jgi:hypothetical protein
MTIPPACFWVVAGLAALTWAGPAAAGGDLTFHSRADRHTSLLELYTSEGCSSCPPAEAWLGGLTTSPELWTEIVPVAFHVDYWDSLGWRDRFASPAATERQRAYAASWGSDSVYTPGFVLDGREWRDWAGYRAGELPPAAQGAGCAGQLSATVRDGKTVTVIYRSADRPAAGREVSVAVLGCNLNSNVKAGENRGRSLRHDFVALSCQTKKLSPGKDEASAVFELPPPLPGDAQRLALAVWVQEPGHAGIQQSTGGWLTASPATVTR